MSFNVPYLKPFSKKLKPKAISELINQNPEVPEIKPVKLKVKCTKIKFSKIQTLARWGHTA